MKNFAPIRKNSSRAIMCAFSVLLAGCPAPIQKCTVALYCIQVQGTGPNPNCPNLHPDPKGNSQVMWQAVNNHDTTAIRARFLVTLTHHDQPTLPGIETYHVSFEPIQPGTANPLTLGCEFTTVPTSPGAYDEYNFTPDYACFVNDPSCAQPTAISDIPGRDCLTKCQGPNCLDVDLRTPATSDMQQAQKLLNDAGKSLVDGAIVTKADLSSLFGLGGLCPQRGILTVGNGQFVETGPSCTNVVTLMSKKLAIRLPPRIAGNFTQTLHSRVVLDFTDAKQAPNLEWLETNGGNEQVSKIEIDKSGSGYIFKIVGNRHYCIWVRTGNG